MTDHFDPSHIPDEYVPQPGPFRRDAGGPEEQTGQGLAALQQCSDFYGCQQVIRAIYYDQDSVAYLALPNAKVTVTAIDYETDNGDRYVLTDDSFWVWADDNGRVDEFTDPCIDGSHWDQVKISIAPTTPQARATSGINYEDWDINSTEVAVGPTVAYYNRDPEGRCVRVNPQLVVASTAARAVRSVSRTAAGAAAFFGASAPQAELDLKEGTWDFDLPFYDRFRGHIDINDGDVWGSGAQSLAHEFGHFYHDKVIGGLAEVYPFYQGWFTVEVEIGCLVHGFTTYETPSCAYMEGVAHMVAAGALGSDYGQRFSYIASQELMRDTYGYKTEGSVASYLYHIATGSSDGVAIGGGALLDAVSGCRDREPPETGGSTSTAWGFINHVASLAYCVEREQHGTWLPIGGDVEYSALSNFPDPYAAFVIANQYLRDQDETLEVSITGPLTIGAPGTYTWEAMPTGSSGSTSYQWATKEDVFGSTWYTRGTAKTQSLDLGTLAPSSFWIRVTVTSDGEQATASRYVTNSITPGGCVGGICPESGELPEIGLD